jgi:acyl-CoA synthetase (AMP-forming)/AMP-acid ligase II
MPSSRATDALDMLAGGNIACLLSRAARVFGRRPAVMADGSTVTFEALAARAAACSATLARAGLRPGDRVGVLLPRGAEAAAAFFGVAGAGGVAVMVNELYQPRQIDHVLAHAGAGFLLTNAALLGTLPRNLEFSGIRLTPDEFLADDSAIPIERASNDPAQLVYTSGSSGQPKGVLVSHGNLWAGALTVAGYLNVGPEDRIASVLPFGFVYGFNQLMCCLVSGATLVVETASLAQDLAVALRKDRITILAAVPPLWFQLLRAPAFVDAPLPDLRVLTCAGGRLPHESVVALRRAHPQARLFLMYGLSEVFRSTYLPPAEVDDHPDSMGRAIPGAQVFVVGEDLSICPPGEVGELVHRGPTVALGYWNDPEATDRVFRQGPLPTLGIPAGERVVFSGDFVRADEAGRLYYVGRRDHMIKTLGYRISPDEVADVIRASGEALEAVVLGEPDPVRGQRIVAAVTLSPGGSVAGIRRYCAGELPRYMQPFRVTALPTLHRGPVGKYDYEAIRSAMAAAGSLGPAS